MQTASQTARKQRNVFHSDQTSDVLTAILRVTRMEARLLHRREFAPPWGMTFAGPDSAIFHIVEQGVCWLRPMGGSAIRLTAGDFVVLPNSPGHELMDDPYTAATRSVRDMMACRDVRGRVSLAADSEGGLTTLTCGEFRYPHMGAHPLFSRLPALIHIRGEQGQAVEWLAIALQFIADELENTRPGRDTIISRLMDILFIMVVRYWIDHHAASEKGWLSALRDPQIASALGDIHRQPEHTWTVEKLAAGAHLSRSAFAARFTALVGEPPLAYLTRWRMQLAMAWLLDDTETLEAIARKVGYSSAYAFSKTFKRLVGVAPGEYRRGQHKAAE